MPEPRSKPVETLARASLFAALSAAELAFLAERSVARKFSSGEIVFSEGDPCAGMYVVEAGHVRIFKTSADGREQVLSIDGPGGSVAELPVFDGGSYPASVSAVEDSTLLFIAKQDFHALCVAHPQVALKVLRVIGARLRKLIGIIEELSFTTVRNRLAAFLVRMARHQGARVEAGFEITLPMSNQELASQIGTVRELVSRNLSRLQSEKLIQMDGRKIVVNVKALEKELEGEPTP
ncbi:MAG: Crp/Fnr family transcriptional regulator [Terriglobales bacterium]|jgi:CRP/FNR family transcriptional regulator